MTVRMLASLILGCFLVMAANAADFVIKSSAFANNTKIPVTNTCDGKNIPPALTWTNAPDKTESFALIVYSPDAPTGGPFYNWVLYNIPSSTTALNLNDQSLPQGTLVGLNSYGETGYASPCPPDSLTHHYIFALYALDTTIDLPEEADVEQVRAAIKWHIIKETRLVGTYSH